MLREKIYPGFVSQDETEEESSDTDEFEKPDEKTEDEKDTEESEDSEF